MRDGGSVRAESAELARRAVIGPRYGVRIEASGKQRRPPHRPSRRHVVVDGAMGLFATLPVDEVTVQDIAAAVEMTPAAVYYHFASKEQILIEGMRQFAEALLDVVRDNMPDEGDPDGINALVVQILASIAKQRSYAYVYYVNSMGLNMMVEALRRETRTELIELLRVAIKSVRGRTSAAEAGVMAVGLVSLIETSVASMLNQDASYRGIGARRFPRYVAEVADRVIGLDA
jgi:AcrR family transcriptional regulator